MFDTARRKNIEETHSDESKEADWAREWEGRVVLSGGVGFLFSTAFNPTSLEVEQVVKGRCLLAKAQCNEHTLVFINIYAPTNGAERKSFLERVKTRLDCCGSEVFLFLGGDFNCTECEYLDGNHAEPHPASQCALRQLVSSHGLVDVWRRMHTDCRHLVPLE